jgi:hypothetical protein
MGARLTRFLIVVAAHAAPMGVAHSQDAPAAPVATLAGVIRDSTGAPIPTVEVIVTGLGRSTRADYSGGFRIDGIPPGAHRVWFRRLGYMSAQFDWAAKAGERTEIVVVMTPIPRSLDPVLVRAQEDRDLDANASILGTVVDTAGVAVDGAEVQLVGANRSGLTRANGGFLFRPLPVGPYVVRVRKLGYEPATWKLNLVAGDDREVIIRMKPLPAQLAPVIVTEKSGYDPTTQLVYDDLERRMRWKSFKSPVLGPEDLKRFYGMDLDYMMTAMNTMVGRFGDRTVPTSIMRGVPQPTSPNRLDRNDADACVLLNGKTPLRRPLRTFNTADIDLIELYPPGTELTGTVSARMTAACQSASLFRHPWYYVIWEKGSR